MLALAKVKRLHHRGTESTEEAIYIRRKIVSRSARRGCGGDVVFLMPTKRASTKKTSAKKSSAKKSSAAIGAPARRARSKAKRLKVISSKVVFQGKVFHVTADEVQEPSGVVAKREIIHHSGSIVILAVEESGREPRVLLERQYRYAAQDYLLELPAGRIDPGEKALAGAKRELLEETGFRAKQWEKALTFYPSPGFLDETMVIYLARELAVGEAQPEADEVIGCELTPLSQVMDMIFSGRIRDGKTIAGVLWLAESMRRQGK